MPDLSPRFDTVSDDYALFRPSYPKSLLDRLGERFGQIEPHGRVWLDVGCGTGIFTRQLADGLPADTRVIGLEPSSAMREKAERASSGGNIEYRDGLAEMLPLGDGEVAAVSAATAAHWFDRPRFYGEAVRVLEPGGLLAVLQYVRDIERSPAAAALDAYLNRTGGPRAYRRPDYAAELARRDGLETVDAWSTHETLRLDPAGFVGLALSSSHAAASVAKLGRDRVQAELEQIAKARAGRDGSIPYGYRFDLFGARKARSS